MDWSKCRLLKLHQFSISISKITVRLKIVDTLLNLRRTTNNSTETKNQNKSAGFNYIASLTAQKLNGIHDNSYGEEGCIKKIYA